MKPSQPLPRATTEQVELLVSRKSGSFPAGEIIRFPAKAQDLDGLIEEFCRRYPNAKTAFDYRNTLRRLFLHTGCGHPAELSEGDHRVLHRARSCQQHGLPALY